ncbi:unnamed protein product [Symbiodinium microadriaticum]|nr:unnamed protein product [Symbiodinium microadriaticum]
MHIALNCGRYQDGCLLYDKICNLKLAKDTPVYTAALKLFAKVGQSDRVRDIWEEATRMVQINVPLAAARIAAAAADGDVLAAAAVLDHMNQTGVPIGIGHISSAIRACWGSKDSHKPARYLFQLLLDLDLEPDIITFTCFIGACITAPLEDVLSTYANMKERGIEVNQVFAETFLVTVLRKPQDAAWSLDNLVTDVLPAQSPACLDAAREGLADFKAAGIKFSKLTARIDRALHQIQQMDV